MECVYSWLIAVTVSLFSGPFFIILGLLALWCIGFTAIGVAGASIAATCQSGIGLVAAGSWFSALQAIGAGGVTAVQPCVYIGCSAINLVVAIVIMYYEGCHISECPCHN